MSRLQKFISLSTRHKLLLLQAWLMLGGYRIVLRVVPLKRITAGLEHHIGAVPSHQLDETQQKLARTIGSLVTWAASATPWQSRCLVQVLVAQQLLAARGVPGQFHMGVCRGSEDGREPEGLSAHAWLQCAEDVVCGGAGHERFTVVSTYVWSGM